MEDLETPEYYTNWVERNAIRDVHHPLIEWVHDNAPTNYNVIGFGVSNYFHFDKRKIGVCILIPPKSFLMGYPSGRELDMVIVNEKYGITVYFFSIRSWLTNLIDYGNVMFYRPFAGGNRPYYTMKWFKKTIESISGYFKSEQMCGKLLINAKECIQIVKDIHTRTTMHITTITRELGWAVYYVLAVRLLIKENKFTCPDAYNLFLDRGGVEFIMPISMGRLDMEDFDKIVDYVERMIENSIKKLIDGTNLFEMTNNSAISGLVELIQENYSL